MKLRLSIAVLTLSAFAFAQHGGGHAGGSGMGMGSGMGASSGTGMGQGSAHDGMGGTMGSNHGQGQPGSSMDQGRTPSEILSKNSRLSDNLQKLLPQGMTAQQACSGFKNLGQCVAAIHVSHNLSIPFADLKNKVTGSGAESLGKAIQTLKPGTNAKAEAKKGQQQANQDLSGNS